MDKIPKDVFEAWSKVVVAMFNDGATSAVIGYRDDKSDELKRIRVTFEEVEGEE